MRQLASGKLIVASQNLAHEGHKEGTKGTKKGRPCWADKTRTGQELGRDSADSADWDSLRQKQNLEPQSTRRHAKEVRGEAGVSVRLK